tara:strand:- start:45 stop:680 length:636 start_codon:yes stop_codon:yes gene_type:complete
MAVNKTLGEHTAKELSKRIKKKEDLKKICLDEHMPSLATARKWIKENKYGAFKVRPGKSKAVSTGRPSIYTEEIADEILYQVMCGKSIRTICSAEGMPERRTVLLWKANNKHGFHDQYTIAFKTRVEEFAEQVVDISDDSTNDFIEKSGKDGSVFMALNPENIARSKLRVDIRYKIMTKLIPDYHDKQTIDVNTKDLTPIYNRVIKKAEKK